MPVIPALESRDRRVSALQKHTDQTDTLAETVSFSDTLSQENKAESDRGRHPNSCSGFHMSMPRYMHPDTHSHAPHTHKTHQPPIINSLSLLPGQPEETLGPEPHALLQNPKLRKLRGYLKHCTPKVCLGDAIGPEDPDYKTTTLFPIAPTPSCGFLSVLDPTGPNHSPAPQS